ncbi:NHL repeat-containing protein [Hymenobacter psychrotolerans]|uniref:Sugar lactone lactonase YvrE n=1 Tax=Hymenobacter psychrotolerans DSM 18569 TaxID=1121959 RepID=A0A1M6X7M1_9BACT|nr:NHL repeat-containing protein [Hymenobacter psychrotolerans]SHL01913.1 Sugar lactone lactonase YvrE [Hymenobacter psychrotolerans DSM 18569]
MSHSASVPRWLLFLALLGVAGCHEKKPPAPAAEPATYTVGVLAGTNSSGGLADGPAASAAFNNPVGLAADAQGTIYVADFLNHRIRKVTAAGNVTTLAGSGAVGRQNGGYVDGPGSTARFNNPTGIAVDVLGTAYVTDGANYCIRKISPAGVVSTLAGSGVRGFADGDAATAQFDLPNGIAVDRQGVVYVADGANYRIRKISPAGQVSTLAGSGVAGYADGTGAAAQFQYVAGLALDGQGNLFVADLQNHRIRKVSPAGVVTTVAGSGTSGYADGAAAAAQFKAPAWVAVDADGTLFVTDGENHRIRKISTDGQVSTIAGTGDMGFANGPGLSAQFILPYGLTIDAQSTLYLTQQVGSYIRKIARD